MLTDMQETYNPRYFNNLFETEKNHFWFRSRTKLILWAFREYFPNAVKFLEIGSGTGYVLSSLEAAFPGVEMSGSDLYEEGLTFAESRVKRSALFQMDVLTMPFNNVFDVIGAFDVLEHINEDNMVLEQIYKAVKPGGGILLTVPQHPFLWTKWDDAACHKRRYTVGELKTKVKRAGFEIVLTTSFMSLLFPVMLLSRVKSRVKNQDMEPEDIVLDEMRIGTLANSLCETVMDIELKLLKRGLRLPFGGSLFLAAKKSG